MLPITGSWYDAARFVAPCPHLLVWSQKIGRNILVFGGLRGTPGSVLPLRSETRLSLLALATAAAFSDIGHMKNLPRRTADHGSHETLIL